MAGDAVIRGASPVEWIEESTFASAEDGAFNWFGLGTSWSATEGVNSESITYLPEFGATNKLSKRVNIDHSEFWNGDVTYHPQNFDLLQYFTGADGGTGDDPSTIQIGEVNEDASSTTFRQLLGGMGEEVTVSVDEDSTFEVSGSFIFADGEDWDTTDYVSAGSHAAEDTSEPHAYKHLSNVEYGGSSLEGAVESLEFTVSNDVAITKDPDEARDSLIASLTPVDREITASLSLTYDSYDLATEVRSYTAQDLTFDIGSTSFTISDVQFPEFSHELSPDDLVGDSIDSDPATDISWS